jgi:hypothetical protein
MDQTRGEERAETARQNDDSDIIEAAEWDSLQGERQQAANQQGSEGGILQTDLGSSVDQERATEPNRHESVKKGDHIARGDGESPPHPAEKTVTER